MDESFRAAVETLGIHEHSGREAAAELLLVLRSKSDPVDFGRLLAAVPGAAALLATRPPTHSPPATGVGGQLQRAASLLGGRAGDSAASLGRKTGLPAGDVGPFVTTFVTFLEQKAGSELVGRILARAPELAALAR